MKFKDIKINYNEKTAEPIFGLTGDISIEQYLTEWIDEGETYTIAIHDIANISIEIARQSIIHLLIDDMYEDNPTVLTDKLADKLLESGEDVINEAIKTETFIYIDGILRDILEIKLKSIKEQDIIWE